MSAPNPFMDLASKELVQLLSDDIEILAQKFLDLDYDEVGGSSKKKGNASRKGISPQQKCTTDIRQLAYGVAADKVDEYVRIEYLRRPNKTDVRRLLEEHLNVHGFLGMLRSVDCMHWTWKNCPTAWKGMYTRGDHVRPTIMLEAVASHDLWIWHAYFGVAGSNNDINVINQSPLFNEVLEGNATQIY
ncbi:uncharacterized protein LOC143599919 [Bidens hawaiensis]|uniref:uncharacterized protein LOC143599919 n=1 Tax=Bidens hawaiensis TaxID=980011 RepID=UPI004049247F